MNRATWHRSVYLPAKRAQLRQKLYDLGPFFIFFAALAALIVLALAWPWGGGTPAAQAHHAKMSASPHLWFRDILFGKTEAPPIFPVEKCTEALEGEFIILYDPKLSVWVHWTCKCPDDGYGCRWFRVAFYPEKPYYPGAVTTRKWSTDTHRTCLAIVCKRHRHYHWWPAMLPQGDRA